MSRIKKTIDRDKELQDIFYDAQKMVTVHSANANSKMKATWKILFPIVEKVIKRSFNLQSIDNLFAKRRVEEITIPRHFLRHFLWHIGFPFHFIAESEKRITEKYTNHSTVIHSRNVAMNLHDTDPHYAGVYDKIKKGIIQEWAKFTNVDEVPPANLTVCIIASGELYDISFAISGMDKKTARNLIESLKLLAENKSVAQEIRIGCRKIILSMESKC